MAKRLELPKFQAFTDAAPFLSGGKVYTYEAGTSTKKASYTTPAGDVENENPVVLDSRGSENIYLKGAYKINILDEDDVQVTGWPVDNVEGGLGEGAMDDYYYPDATAADQGITGNSDTIRYAVDTIITDNGTIYLRHNGGTATTTYTLTTSQVIPSNVTLEVEPGAVIDLTGDLTINGKFEAGMTQVFSGTGEAIFGGACVKDIIPQWFNSDPYTNGFEAIRAAMRSAIASTATGSRSVYIPAGDYTIDTTGVFSDIDATDKIGIKVSGAGSRATRLILSPSGSDLWFYNNVTTARLQFAVFEDIAFMGLADDTLGYAAISEYAKGFRLYSTTAGTGSHEQGFTFNRCYFSALDTAFSLEGDDTASEIKVIASKIYKIKDVVYYINNVNSVNHVFIDTDIELIYGDIFRFGPLGGGAISAYGGSWIMDSSSGSDEYVIDIPATSAIGANASITNLNGIRFELRGDNTKFLDNSASAGCEINVDVEDCIFWSTAAAIKTNWVHITYYSKVVFRGCVWSWNNVAYYETYTFAAPAPYGQSGRIKWIDSAVHEDLSEHISFTSSYGRASARGCSGAIAATAAVPFISATDFDLFGPGLMVTSQADANFSLKTTSILYADSFPFNNVNEAGVKLPKNALIKSIRVRKDAAGVSTSDYCLHASNNDKTTVYVSSIPDDIKYVHRINYERGAISTAQLTTRTDNDTGVFTFHSDNHSISEDDTVNVNWVEAGTVGRRIGMTVSSIVMTTQGSIVISLDAGAGANLPSANVDCHLSSVLGFIEVGSTDNERIVRLWSSDGDKSTAGGDSAQTGYAIVEYY